MGSATPSFGWAHSEGVEAADPATPPAVLSFEGAARHYAKLDSAPLEWRVLFSSDAGHAGHVMTTEATGAAAHMHAEPAQHSPASHQQ